MPLYPLRFPVSWADLDEDDRWSLENDPVVKVKFCLIRFQIQTRHYANSLFCMTERISCSLTERGGEAAERGKRKGSIRMPIS